MKSLSLKLKAYVNKKKFFIKCAPTGENISIDDVKRKKIKINEIFFTTYF